MAHGMMTDEEATADHAATCGCDVPIATNVDVGGKFCRWLHLSTKPDSDKVAPG